MYTALITKQGQSRIAYYINVERGGLCPADLVVKARQELGAGNIILVLEMEN